MSAAGEHWLTRRALAGDTEAAAAVVILCDPIFARDGRVWAHVDDDIQGIHFDDILGEGTWSSGERVLLQLAANLWSGSGHVDMAAICGLSDGFFTVAMEAIEARRWHARPLPLTLLQRDAVARRAQGEGLTVASLYDRLASRHASDPSRWETAPPARRAAFTWLVHVTRAYAATRDAGVDTELTPNEVQTVLARTVMNSYVDLFGPDRDRWVDDMDTAAQRTYLIAVDEVLAAIYAGELA